MCTFCQFPRTRISTSTSRQIRRTSAFTVLHSDTRWAGQAGAAEAGADHCVQVNHSFLPNCKFGSMWHPRWGRVRTVVTTKDVEQGQELLVTQYLQYLRCLYIYNIYRWTMVMTCCDVRSGTATSGRRRWGVTTPASSTGTTEQQADHWAVSRIRYVHMYIFSYIIHYQLFSSLME